MNVGHSECDPIRVPVERIGPATAQPVPMWNGVEHSPVRLQPNGRPRVSDRLMTDPLSMCTIGTTPRGGLVALDLDTRRRHVHLIGQTGSGKSTLMLNMIAQDLAAGRGLALFDPHGDLAERVLAMVPSRRAHELVYLNPGDLDRPIGFNVLESVEPRYRATVADGVVAAFKHVWPDFWGPRLEYILLPDYAPL